MAFTNNNYMAEQVMAVIAHPTLGNIVLLVLQL